LQAQLSTEPPGGRLKIYTPTATILHFEITTTSADKAKCPKRCHQDAIKLAKELP